MSDKKVVLIILDGWGHGDKTKSDAIFNAKTPFIDSLYSNSLNCELLTDGENVGLPKGQMGNSEVGHLNIGAGRVVYQDLQRINAACQNNSITEEENLNNSFMYAKENDKHLHLIGLVSDGGIHSHQNHLYKLCQYAKLVGVKNVFIHAFTDGRDTDPRSAKKYIEQLQDNLFGARIASVCGRYYAMDRDNRWERIRLAYDLMVNGKGRKAKNLLSAIQNSYDKHITDEFIQPILSVDKNDKPIAVIKEDDAVICFNFRTDRCREITTALTQQDMPDFGMKKLNIHYTTMTNYDNSFKNINVIYDKEYIKNTLGEVLVKNKKLQLRISETEKYPHVTFFFSGGREKKFKGEKRVMIDSPKVATYDLQPEMSAKAVTLKTVEEIQRREADFICLNYANADMVGHTGDYDAIIKAVETVDLCVSKVVNAGINSGYRFIIIADHGNADFSINSDNSPNTTHTNNPVPCFVLNTQFNNIKNGILADIAPTVLKIMDLEIPKEMTGDILIK